MLAASYSGYCADNSLLTIGEVPDPKLGPGQVLIEVRAAGVNPVDWKVMAGGLDAMMDTVFPVIPGWDVAGVVSGVGPDTPEFAAGDEVMAYARKDAVHGGTFARLVSVSARDVARRPAALDWAQAGGLPLVGLTALRALDALRVGRRDTLLIHAAAGGVGSMAVQIGRARGARVIGTASEPNHGYLSSLGAEPVSYGEGLADRVRTLAPDGATTVLDCVGGQVETTLAVLADGGRHVSIADPDVTRHGGRWIWVRPDGAALTELAYLVDRGLLTVEVAETFPLSDVGRAFDRSRTGRARGKLVIVP